MSALIIAEHNNKQLLPATIATINAARILDPNLTILIIGYDCSTAANHAAIIANVNNVLYLDDLDYKNLLAENITNVVIDLFEKETCGIYKYIIAANTKFGKNILPRIASKLNVEQISEVTKIIAYDTFERSIYHGNATQIIKINCKVKCLTIRTINFSNQFFYNATTAKIVPLNSNKDLIDPRIIFNSHSIDLTQIDDKNQIIQNKELTSAKIVVAGGAGLKNKENFKMIEQLAYYLDAAIGASKYAVDAGFVSKNLQIGQTGKIIAPEIYIAIGISGSIHHLAGIKESKTIIAINNDENAPIVKIAHYAIIDDLFKVLPEIITELQQLFTLKTNLDNKIAKIYQLDQ